MSSYSSASSANSQATENNSIMPNKPLAASISQLCSVKLDRSNFLSWECSILPVIRGHKMEGYLLGTKPCPSQFITEGTETKTNPTYEEWVAAVQLLLRWIYNTLTSEIAS